MFLPLKMRFLLAILLCSFYTHLNALLSHIPKPYTRKTVAMQAKPQRLSENVKGPLYVNEKCINCAACSNFASLTFDRSHQKAVHFVKKQPETDQEIQQAKEALLACPVAAIRVDSTDSSSDDNKALIQKLTHSSPVPFFPKPFPHSNPLPNVYWTGHHNEASFGATPYLLQTTFNDQPVWIMIDTPQFSIKAANDIISVTGPNGPDYLFLTHVDDTADHGKWAEHFALQRIFHAGDLGRYNWLGDTTLEDVEILLPTTTTSASSTDNEHLTAYRLDGTVLSDNWNETCHDPVVILHTPGHSPGSVTLYVRPSLSTPGILFTGDTYAYTTREGGHMSGFPRYGHDRRLQMQTLQKLVDLEWQLIAPGHGHPRDYRGAKTNDDKVHEMQEALQELRSW